MQCYYETVNCDSKCANAQCIRPVRRRNKMKKKPALPTEGRRRKLHNTLVYVRQHWQLYLIFMLPAFLLTVIFRYVPMSGILIAFTEYNPIRGIWASEWVGFSHFTRFLSSPDARI